MKTKLPLYLPYLYISGMALIAIGLPLGKFLISLGIFLLVFSWLLDCLLHSFSFGKKFKQFFKNRPMVLLVVVFLIHVLGLIYTENISFALDDIRIKLPFLALPVIIAGMPSIKRSRFHFLMKVFILSLLASAILSYINIMRLKPSDIREGVLFVSHIRLSLMLVLGIAYTIFSWKRETILWRLVHVIFFGWTLFFMWRTEAATGIALLIVSLLFISFLHIRKSSKRKSIGLVSIAGLSVIIVYFAYSYYQFFTPKEVLSEHLLYTKNGELYYSMRGDTQLENGYYINHYIAPEELSAGWKERSNIPIEGKDALGQPIKATLTRYMTSMGLKKDLEGMAALNDNDILQIENGITNVDLPHQSGFSRRLNALFFEWNAYRNGANPSSNSVMMRVEFWKTGINVISDNLILGVGTGDINDEMIAEYKRSNTILDQDYRKRVHNQYLAFAISFGLVGLIIILYCLLWPYFYGYGNKYATMFLLIYLMSFLTEDTLETQAGATFVAFFSCLFLGLYKEDVLK